MVVENKYDQSNTRLNKWTNTWIYE